MKLKIAEESAETPRQYCPICEHKIDRASCVSESGEYATPTAGDATVCIRCANWLVFRDDLSMRPMTPEERRELTLEQRAKLVKVTRAVNQSPGPDGSK